MKNIALIGMSGVGKTTLGKELAKKFNMQFIDTDYLIEENQKMSISEIFSIFGTKFFREKETEIIRTLSNTTNAIISTGGGIVLKEENIKILKKYAIIIYIDRPCEEIIKDIDIRNRPLLNTKEKIFDIYESRKNLYEKYASYVIKNIDKIKTINEMEKLVKKIYAEHKFAVIGNPIEHSLSPIIHKLVLEDYFDEMIYEKILVDNGNIEEFMNTANIYDGFNITMPNKTEIIKYLYETSDIVNNIKSCNTVKNNEGKFIGENTDIGGFFLSLENNNVDISDKNIAFLGCGSVGVALISGFLNKNAKKISVAVKNNALINSLYKNNDKIITYDFNEKSLIECCKNADILINTTPLGMVGCESNFNNFNFLLNMSAIGTVVDLIYKPNKTDLLKNAENYKLKAINGLEMLIYQAILADEIYLDKKLDKNYYYNKIINHLLKEGII